MQRLSVAELQKRVASQEGGASGLVFGVHFVFKENILSFIYLSFYLFIVLFMYFCVIHLFLLQIYIYIYKYIYIYIYVYIYIYYHYHCHYFLLSWLGAVGREFADLTLGLLRGSL